jgi:uncharacterized protein DUF397
MGESAWQRSEGCADGNCVEVKSGGDDLVLLRSSLEPATVLRLTTAEWSAFRIGMERGDFDRPH